MACLAVSLRLAMIFFLGGFIDTNLIALIEEFGSENKCRDLLEEIRWPKGPDCPRCHSAKISRIQKRNQFDCDSCRYQFSVLSGTSFSDTHLPLWKWFLAIYLMCESRKGMSANQIKRTLAISYKTAWFLCHRIRAAMQEASEHKLDGIVEVDETYVGGKLQRIGSGRAKAAKEIVLGIRQRQGELRFEHIKDVTARTLGRIIENNVSEDAEYIMTDEFTSYPFAIKGKRAAKHRQIRHKERYVDGIVHTNTVENAFSLFKRGLMGTWHKISAKHLPAYLDEMTFRFNRRDEGSTLFADTLQRLICTPNVSFDELTA
jgi:transposase-like protein